MKQDITKMKKEKGNELYLEWLERNAMNVDTTNKKQALNYFSNDSALVHSNEALKQSVRNNLTQRRYTTNATLQPPNGRPAPKERGLSFDMLNTTSEVSLPQIGGR